MPRFIDPDTPLPPLDRGRGITESSFHPTIGLVICQRLLDGETVKQITADPRMPSERVLYHWVTRHPDFAADYQWVRDDQARERAARRAAAPEHWRRVRAHRRAVAGKPPRDWVAGRKSSYDQAWAEAFCERLAGGDAASRISADPTMPSRTQISRWLMTVPEFREMYADARDWHLGWLELEIEAIAADVWKTGLAYAKAEVARLEGRIGRMRAKTWRQVPA